MYIYTGDGCVLSNEQTYINIYFFIDLPGSLNISVFWRAGAKLVAKFPSSQESVLVLRQKENLR